MSEVDIPIKRAHPSDGGGTRFRRRRAHRDDGRPTAYVLVFYYQSADSRRFLIESPLIKILSAL